MATVDLHTHIGSFPLPVGACGADDLLRVMDRLDIALAVASSTEAIFYDMTGGNAALSRDLARHDRLRGYVFANPNQLALSCEQVRRYLSQERFVGLKLYSGAYVGHPLDCPSHRAILEVVATEFPWAIILFHCGENDPRNFPGLQAVAHEFPDLVFLAGHMGSRLWREALPVLSTEPNILAEISAPVPARCRIEDAVRYMGAQRVVFGSDFPIIHPGYMMGCVLDADIGAQERSAILQGNATALLARAERRIG